MNNSWIQTVIDALIEREGYQAARYIPNTGVCAIMKMNFTWGLFVNCDLEIYQERYCYEQMEDANNALANWDGDGDPPGPWIKAMVTGRLGPGAAMFLTD